MNSTDAAIALARTEPLLPRTPRRDKARYVVDTLEINAAYQVSIVLRDDVKVPINRFPNIIAASMAVIRYRAARKAALAMAYRPNR